MKTFSPKLEKKHWMLWGTKAGHTFTRFVHGLPVGKHPKNELKAFAEEFDIPYEEINYFQLDGQLPLVRKLTAQGGNYGLRSKD